MLKQRICFIVKDLAPIDVANELATSFAPIPIDAINEKNPAVIIIHK